MHIIAYHTYPIKSLMQMLPLEYVFYKMAVLSIDTTKEPLKLCRKKFEAVFNDIFDNEPTTLVLTEQRRWKKPGRKEGVRKNPRKSSLHFNIIISLPP